ncbi:hypothetical protein E6O75_ATG04665 [Venturia nashicola]|uniref:Uncharacterized protein n=1 Tax=Venturia nashicola TaxID=86259 RepID=A0A4Z1P0K4_9PEZI|nr:hypothetical protein E6O75_ATG04665 [Venturia nashicola]
MEGSSRDFMKQNAELGEDASNSSSPRCAGHQTPRIHSIGGCYDSEQRGVRASVFKVRGHKVASLSANTMLQWGRMFPSQASTQEKLAFLANASEQLFLYPIISIGAFGSVHVADRSGPFNAPQHKWVPDVLEGWKQKLNARQQTLNLKCSQNINLGRYMSLSTDLDHKHNLTDELGLINTNNSLLQIRHPLSLSQRITTMQLTNLFIATVLATTTLAAASPKWRGPTRHLKAHCNGVENDCCFNNYDGCRNQRGSIGVCTLHSNLCSNFKTDAAHGAVTPSCDGDDCCKPNVFAFGDKRFHRKIASLSSLQYSANMQSEREIGLPSEALLCMNPEQLRDLPGWLTHGLLTLTNLEADTLRELFCNYANRQRGREETS